MKLSVIIKKGEDGYFAAHCPSLKSGCSQGKTKEEALRNIQEAIELYLEPELDYFIEDENSELCELVL
jgi:predicted RNase H-like HicB family nuclease